MHCFIEIPHIKKEDGRIDRDELKKKIPDRFNLHDDFFHYFDSEMLPDMETDDPTLDERLFRKVVDPSEKDYDILACYHGEVDDEHFDWMEEHPDFIFWDSPAAAFCANDGAAGPGGWWEMLQAFMGQSGPMNPAELNRQWLQWINPSRNPTSQGELHRQCRQWMNPLGISMPPATPGCGGCGSPTGFNYGADWFCQMSNPNYWSEKMLAAYCQAVSPGPMDAPSSDGGPCVCNTDYDGSLKGSLLDVARALQVDKLWARGLDGTGVSIGIVGAGQTAMGRPWPHYYGGCSQPVPIPNVVGGFPEENWGTMAAAYGHGLMTCTTALGMAPGASIYDIRITPNCSAFTDNLKGPMKAYRWIQENMHQSWFPKILSNSWAIWQSSDNSKYARDPNHPMTRLIGRVVEKGGLTVLFATGNCGTYPPLLQCGCSYGPGKSIWGANGSEPVITVAAANVFHQYLAYSGVGPAGIDATLEKPDICGISNFHGWPQVAAASSYVGTSAATPSVAGAVALLHQAFPLSEIDPATMKSALQSTADQICGDKPWNNYSGYGVVQAEDAFKELEKKFG